MHSSVEHGKRGRTVLALALMGAALALAGCKTTSQRGTDITTGSIGQAQRPASVKEMLALRQRWQKNPRDVRTGMRLAYSLKQLGNVAGALGVMKKLVELRPRDVNLRHRYALELLRANRPVQAEQEYRRLLAMGSRDWKTHNALGSALAEQGRYAEAREQYRLALKLAPANAKVINNIAMSHILEGNPQEAERLLREALPRARGRVATKLRQNLALALGLQGRFEEARYMASHDLSPQEVEANMAYLKRMLGNGQAWSRIAGDQKRG